jgi:hypothetical protein
MGTPMTANIIQIMKHTVNASVLMMTTDHALYCCVAMNHLVACTGEIKRPWCVFYAIEYALARGGSGTKTG